MSHVDEGTLHALVDDELPEGERASVEAHLASCGDCARRFAEATAMARQVHTLLGALDEVAAPITVQRSAPSLRLEQAATPVRAAALASINQTPMQRRMRTVRGVAIAASVMLVAGISYRVGMSRQSEVSAVSGFKPAPDAERAASPAASVVEIAPEAIALPSAPTVRVAPRGGPRSEAEVAVGGAVAPLAAPIPMRAPTVAALPPAPRPTEQAVVMDTTAVAANEVAERVAAAPQRERAAAGVAMRRAAPVAPMTAPSADVASNAGVAAAPAQKSMASALPGYTSVEEVTLPSVTRRRYVAADGATLVLQIAPAMADASKSVVKGAPEFTVSSTKSGSTVRWQRNGLAYELQGPVAPDSLVKLATQLK